MIFSSQLLEWKLTQLCILFLFCVGNSACASFEKEKNHWDLLIFTQHWPNTVCIQWKEKYENHTCLLSQEWAVHGVWPTKIGTIGPGFCNKTWPFNLTALAPIQADLDQHWPNIENGTEEDSLWKHEWQKHGTCAAQLPALASELKYFSQGLAWLQKYDMTAPLSKAGIVPSSTKTYHVSEVWEAVKRTTNTNPAVECLHDAKTGNTYLFEIRICFDKKLTLIDCDGIISGTHNMGGMITNCPADRDIIYPESIPGKSVIDPTKFRSGYTWIDFVEFILWLQWLTF